MLYGIKMVSKTQTIINIEHVIKWDLHWAMRIYTSHHTRSGGEQWVTGDKTIIYLSLVYGTYNQCVNALRPRQNGRHFPDDIFKCIFVNGNIWISIKISLKIVPEVLINKIPALVQIMDWRRPGAKLLSEPMLVSLLTHICVTRPQWVKL